MSYFVLDLLMANFVLKGSVRRLCPTVAFIQGDLCAWQMRTLLWSATKLSLYGRISITYKRRNEKKITFNNSNNVSIWRIIKLFLVDIVIELKHILLIRPTFHWINSNEKFYRDVTYGLNHIVLLVFMYAKYNFFVLLNKKGNQWFYN